MEISFFDLLKRQPFFLWEDVGKGTNWKFQIFNFSSHSTEPNATVQHFFGVTYRHKSWNWKFRYFIAFYSFSVFLTNQTEGDETFIFDWLLPVLKFIVWHCWISSVMCDMIIVLRVCYISVDVIFLFEFWFFVNVANGSELCLFWV